MPCHMLAAGPAMLALAPPETPASGRVERPLPGTTMAADRVLPLEHGARMGWVV